MKINRYYNKIINLIKINNNIIQKFKKLIKIFKIKLNQ